MQHAVILPNRESDKLSFLHSLAATINDTVRADAYGVYGFLGVDNSLFYASRSCLTVDEAKEDLVFSVVGQMADGTPAEWSMVQQQILGAENSNGGIQLKVSVDDYPQLTLCGMEGRCIK